MTSVAIHLGRISEDSYAILGFKLLHNHSLDAGNSAGALGETEAVLEGGHSKAEARADEA